MKIKFNLLNLLIFGSILISSGLQAQEVFGKWKVVNEAGRVNQPIEGLNVIRDFKKEGDEYVDGTLIDPKSGKEYKGKIWVDQEHPNKLNVRGYIAFFYKTKVWERAE